jgi:CRP/FNR family transcriptional regulator, cyclic AMP receptor protein
VYKRPGLHSWIGLLPVPLRDEVLARMRPRTLRHGALVYSVNEDGQETYLVRRGRVRIFDQALDGREILLVVMQEGDCFGEHSLIDHLPRFSSAAAEGDVELLVLRKRDFDVLYARHGDIARSLNLVFSYRFRLTISTAEEASVLSLRQRLTRQLIRLAHTGGADRESVSTSVSDITHEGLANSTGATRQAVSKVLRELEKDGVIDLGYRSITIRDLRLLEHESRRLIGSDLAVPDYRPSENPAALADVSDTQATRRGRAAARRTRSTAVAS